MSRVYSIKYALNPPSVLLLNLTRMENFGNSFLKERVPSTPGQGFTNHSEEHLTKHTEAEAAFNTCMTGYFVLVFLLYILVWRHFGGVRFVRNTGQNRWLDESGLN